MRRKDLAKYDAPLRIQYQWGFDAFNKGRVIKKDQHLVLAGNNLDYNTMQAREWQRGWNDAYYENLRKVKSREQARARS